jgi:uncharacterized C2H2 Zn-finger protein
MSAVEETISDVNIERTAERVVRELNTEKSDEKQLKPTGSDEASGSGMSMDDDVYHLNIAVDLVDTGDNVFDSELLEAMHEIEGRNVFPCSFCEKICKSKGGLTKHTNSKHGDAVGRPNTNLLDKDKLNSIVSIIKQNIIDEKLYGTAIETSVQKVSATEKLFEEVQRIYSTFCRNKNQDKLLKSLYGLMSKSTTLLNFEDSRITNLIMIHIPDHLIGFYNSPSNPDEDSMETEDYENIEEHEFGPLSYIAGYVVKKLKNMSKRNSDTENVELQALLPCLESEQESNSFLQARTRGGLVNPSDDLMGILHEAEINFRKEINASKSKEVLRNIPVDFICVNTICSPSVKSLWENIVVSSGVNPSGETHKLCLENIVKLFLKVRSYSYARDYITQYKIREKQGKVKALRKSLKMNEKEN